MNKTTQAIIALLPKKPLLTPADLAAAYGLATAVPIIADIKVGKLAANSINGRYIISRAAAEAYIEANEYSPDEGTI
ncbi:MAG: hypothetical protein IKA69_06460 [Kiritimatiellae bacterium]|nr:hypothetical protein [Kiritimatiellia bacterium]